MAIHLGLYIFQVLNPGIQPTADQKHTKQNKNSRNFQEAKLKFATCWQLFKLYSIYTVLSVRSRDELKIYRRMCMVYMQILHTLYMGLEH